MENIQEILLKLFLYFSLGVVVLPTLGYLIYRICKRFKKGKSVGGKGIRGIIPAIIAIVFFALLFQRVSYLPPNFLN